MEEKKYGSCPECGAPCEVIEGTYKEEMHDVHYVEHKYNPQPGTVWVKASARLPEISKPTKLIIVKRYEGVPDVFSVKAMTAAQLADIVKYDLANFEWLDEGTAAGREEIDPQEIWDEFSEYINNDIDSCQNVAGSSIMTEASFKKAFMKFKQKEK